MRKLIIILISLCFLSSFSQKPNKTLQDSVFNKGDVIQCPDIGSYFCCRCGPDGVSSNDLDSLKLIGDFLKKHPNIIVQIRSHTDSRGDVKKNKDLSRRRAESFRNNLIKNNGTDSLQVIAVGMGKSALRVSDQVISKAKTKMEKEALHQINRRVDLLVIETKN